MRVLGFEGWRLSWELEAGQSADCHFEPGEMEKKHESVRF